MKCFNYFISDFIKSSLMGILKIQRDIRNLMAGIWMLGSMMKNQKFL